jgi:pilus assembly protein CpaB
MYTRAIALLGLAAFSGTAAVYLARDWIEAQVPRQVVVVTDRVPLGTVVVARRDMFLGDRLDRDKLQEREWPRDAIPEGAFTSLDALLGQQRLVLRAIAKHEPILAGKITGEGGRASLSATIAGTMRAVTVRVNDVAGVAGFVLPGDRVDVLLTHQQERREPRTIILLQYVRVLGIDQDADEQNSEPKLVRAVTLEVTPRHAQKLALATQVGALSLALRNTINNDPVVAGSIGLADLGPGDVPAAAPAVAPLARATPAERRTEPPQGTGRLDHLASVTVTRGLRSTRYRVSRAEPSTPPEPAVKGTDRPIGPTASRLSPFLFGREIRRWPGNVGAGRPIDLLSRIEVEPADLGGDTRQNGGDGRWPGRR